MRFCIFAIAVLLVYQASSSPKESSLLLNRLRVSDPKYGDVNVFCSGDICFDGTEGTHEGRFKRGLDNDGSNLHSSVPHPPRKGEYACAGGVCRAPPRGRGATHDACPHCQFAVKP